MSTLFYNISNPLVLTSLKSQANIDSCFITSFFAFSFCLCVQFHLKTILLGLKDNTYNRLTIVNQDKTSTCFGRRINDILTNCLKFVHFEQQQ